MQTNSSLELSEALRMILSDFPGWSEVKLSDSENGDHLVCAIVQGRAVQFLLEVKSGTWRPESLEKIRERVPRSNLPIVVASALIPQKLAKSLREELKLNYLDTAGNAYLNFSNLQVFRETRAAPLVDSSRKRPHGEAFNPSAVNVGLQLLLDPKLVGASLRQLAALAGISAPSTKFALDAFKDDGYVLDVGRHGRRFVDREAFFHKWVESYNQRCHPKRSLGRYSCDMEMLDIDGCGACWGGEQAAQLLTGNLKPGEHVVYVYDTKIGLLVAKNRLRPDPNGNVELIQASWSSSQEEQGVAPAFVVYADLVNTRDPRCREVAEQLFEKRIQERLGDHAG